MFKQYQLKNYDFKLVFLVLGISIVGIAVIGSASESVQDQQIIGLFLGLLAMAVVSVIDYEFVLKFSYLIYGACIAMLALILVFGDAAGGATRWIRIGGFRFQPSEPAKILVILFFAWFFTKFEENINTWKTLALSAILVGIPGLLIVRQPDLSTGIVIMLTFITLLFLAGLSYKIIGWVLALTIPAIVIFFIIIMQPEQSLLEGYQLRRILAWLNPEKYPDLAFQQLNAKMAIGSGQLWGKGLNNDAPDSVLNGNFIPEPQTDFIFAVVGEELGFIGSTIILLLLLLIVLECIMIGRKAKNMQGKLICGGVAAWIGFQTFVNIGVVTGLLPNTGITLPFVSYGVSSLLSLFIGIGLVLNVRLQVRWMPSRISRVDRISEL